MLLPDTHRLHLLFNGFNVVKKQFWSKRAGRYARIQVGEDEALSLQQSESCYPLGLFLLKAGHSVSANAN
jgi:hypothetical protein